MIFDDFDNPKKYIVLKILFVILMFIIGSILYVIGSDWLHNFIWRLA